MYKIALTLMVLGGWMLSNALLADSDERYRPISNRTVLEECSDCHMAFPPEMLPARSWEKMMRGLENHFGESAELDPETTRIIEEYYVENAGDQGLFGRWRFRGLSDDNPPLRITEMAYFKREHSGREFDYYARRLKVKSPVDCVACHPGARSGYFDDD